MPTFDFFPLLWWGLPLAAAPLVIHLINLLRHRKVPWAAMEFLRASQKKYRTRVMLKQILLLLLRVAALLGIVLALAQPRWKSALGRMLGGGRTAHVVLLDDSYSMGDLSADGRIGDSSSFDRGRLVVERICAELAAAPGQQEVAIGRFSAFERHRPHDSESTPGQSKQKTGDEQTGDERRPNAQESFDIRLQTVTPRVVQEVREELSGLAPSATAAGPRGAVAAAASLGAGFGTGLGVGGAGGAGSGTANVVWLVSDFRAKDWKTADETASLLRQLSDAGCELRLVDCAADGGDGRQPGNITVERLEMAGGVPASGVLVPLEVAVRNDSDRPVRDVAIDLREDALDRPGVRIAEIPAGGVGTQRFDVRFTKAGPHQVEARIAADALAADNFRTMAIDIVDRVDVLLIDGDPTGGGRSGDAFYVATALAPGAGAPTGLRPRIEPPRSLATLDLESFACIWILDVERLDAPEVAALEAYARSGGGVVFFTGPRTKADAVNRSLYRGGEGLFPVPLAGPVDLLPDADAGAAAAPDVVVEEHPVVAVLSGQRNPLLDAVRIERSMAVERGFEPAATSGLRRLLSLRTGGPLVVERPYGDGMAVAVLSTAAPTWNNWARGNPSWVVVMLELESYLARSRRRAESLEVGDPVVVRLDTAVDEIEVDVAVPPAGAIVHQTAVASSAGVLEATLPETSVAGGYTARWRRLDGTERERIFAVNVSADEGQLERIGRERLDRTLAGVAYKYDRAESLQPDATTLAGAPLAKPLLHLLAAVLILEQLVAFSASYHAKSRGKSTA
jgi:hypothetical protein